jgi:hypothetical protein
VIDFTKDSEYIRIMALEANKARTDILADNPEINSQWTPDAIGVMIAKNKIKKTKTILLETYKTMHEAMKNSAEKKRIEKLITELEDVFKKGRGDV